MLRKFFGLFAIAAMMSCSKKTLQPAGAFLVEDRIVAISGEAFDRYLESAGSKCEIDSTGNVVGTGYILKTECKDVCSTYLVNRGIGLQTDLPSTYDQGIKEVLFSPSCRKLLTYAGYDAPDYTDYYEYRSELFVYKFSRRQTDPPRVILEVFSKRWSIDRAVFVDENHIALKLYGDENSSTGEASLQYAILEIR